MLKLPTPGRFTTLSIGGKTLLKGSEVQEFEPKSLGRPPKRSSPNRERRVSEMISFGLKACSGRSIDWIVTGREGG